MIIEVEEKVELKGSNGDVILAFEPGTRLTPIRYSYLPKDPEILGVGSLGQKDIEEDFYIVYLYKHFIGIPKKSCNVPTSLNNGWSPNL